MYTIHVYYVQNNKMNLELIPEELRWIGGESITLSDQYYVRLHGSFSCRFCSYVLISSGLGGWSVWVIDCYNYFSYHQTFTFFNFTNFRFKSHCKWTLRFCKRLYHSTIEDRKNPPRSGRKNAVFEVKKAWKSAFFRAIFWVSMVSIWGWYQCERMTGWLVEKNGDREHKHWYALPYQRFHPRKTGSTDFLKRILKNCNLHYSWNPLNLSMP